MQRVVMVGNCQIRELHSLYLRFAESSAEQEVVYIRSYEDISHDARVAIQAADIIVEQVQDFRPKADIASISSAATRILVPVVNASFLWPFAGQPHPDNPSRPFCEAGPYGPESSDSYLNRLIKRGVTADLALELYAGLDINAMVNLDRLFEAVVDKQRQRDEVTGFSIADDIVARFRDEATFRTPYHPNSRLTISLATQFFERMGVNKIDTDRMRRSLRVSPFPRDELPYHPSVCRHFGLRFVTEERRYRFMNEGYFTFREFVLRYMSCAWNEPLEEGLALLKAGSISAARELIENGVALAPDSAPGRTALGVILDNLGSREKAISEVRRAIAIEPEHAPYRAQLGLLLSRDGDMEAAEHQLRLAAALDSFHPYYYALLSRHLMHQGLSDDAFAAVRQGLACNPRASELLLVLGEVFSRRGQPDEAERAIREAMRWAPSDCASLKALARLFNETGQFGQAVSFWRRAVAMDSNDLNSHAEYLQTLLLSGDLSEAEQVARSAIKRFSVGQLHYALSQVLRRLNRLDEAIEAARDATKLDVGNPQFHSYVADLLIDRLLWGEAEKELRLVIASGRQNGHTYFQLGIVLAARGEFSGAVTARKEAVRLEPNNPHRHAQLHEMSMRANDFAEAERAIRDAIALSPNAAVFRADLSELLSHTGRWQEAIDVAEEGLSLEPDNQRLRALLGRIAERSLPFGIEHVSARNTPSTNR